MYEHDFCSRKRFVCFHALVVDLTYDVSFYTCSVVIVCKHNDMLVIKMLNTVCACALVVKYPKSSSLMICDVILVKDLFLCGRLSSFRFV